LLRQVDAIFAPKMVVPPNLGYLQSGRFAFVVSANLDNPDGHPDHPYHRTATRLPPPL
jgi:hypothetical protein